MNQLLDLGRKYEASQPRKAIGYVLKALELSQKLADVRQQALSHISLGRLHKAQKRLRQAEAHLLEASKLLEKGTGRETYEAFYQYADIQSLQGNFTTALTYHYKAETIALATADPRLIGLTHKAIAEDLYHLGDYAKAVEYTEKAIERFQTAAAPLEIGQSLELMGQTNQALQQPLQAIVSFQRSLAVYEQLRLRKDQVRVLRLVASVLERLKNYPEAVTLLQKALRIADTAKSDVDKAALFQGLGHCYLLMSESEKAVFYASIALRAQRRLRNPEAESEAHRTLSTAYTYLGKYDPALRHYKAFVSLRDRFASQTTAREAAEMRLKYETEKIGKEIGLLQREKKIQELDIDRKQNLIYGAVAALFLSIVAALMLHAKNLRERHFNHQLQSKNTEINSQKGEIERQRDEITLRQRELTDAYTSIRGSISYAKRIQEAVLPEKNWLARHFSDHLVYFCPKDIVSGDFYWFSEVDGKVVIVVADCTGHGVPGAFMSLIGNTVLNRTVNELKIVDPKQVLAHMHEGIVQALQQQAGHNRDGIDLSVCVYDPNRRSLCFAGARSTLFLVDAEGVRSLAGDRHSIGGLNYGGQNGREYHNHTANLTKPCMAYLASDGLADQFDPTFERKFSWPRFRSLLEQMHTLPGPEQEKHLEDEMTTWRNGGEQTDDILVLGFRIP